MVMWAWLEGLTGAAPVVVGSAVGSFLGLISLLIGALVNAKLNRARDDYVLRQKARAVAAALSAEISILKESLVSNNKTIDVPGTGHLMVSDPAMIMKIFPRLIGEFYLLDTASMKAVSVLHAVLDQYVDTLFMLGATPSPFAQKGRVIVDFPAEKAKHLRMLNESIIRLCDEGQEGLKKWIEA
ncbi:hypothetical protein [Rhizobium ruizarguesonis]|uniref:hypothetical protein n=1 Tax=Rhizobium ruizarguesonis TaxID=2081791 RepID=UPI001954E043|nr:hypothetical protein [Rhizobium ruizarguesonis]